MPNPYDDWYANAQARGQANSQPAAANPNDPNQVSNWGIGIAQEQAKKSLYDPETLKSLQSIFGPYFAQQRQNLTSQMNTDRATAGRQAGAFAASQGFANPGQFSSGVGQRVTSAYAPQFGQLQQSQLGQLLNAGAASSQFGAQNAQFLINAMLQKAGMNFQEQQSPDIWGQILGGLISAGGTIGGALIGGPPGAAVGATAGKAIK